jgi:protein involved in polysaccharide export with SLBB domain
VVMAGGFLTTAEPKRVAIIRRGPDGRPMLRYVNLGDAVRHAPDVDAVPLRRFDVVFVPRSGIANVDLWVQQHISGVVPVQFSYATGNAGYLTTR